MVYDNRMLDSMSKCLNESVEDKKGGRVIFDYTVSRHDDAEVKCGESEFLTKNLKWIENGHHDEAEFDVSQNEIIKALKEVGFDEEDFCIVDKPVVLNRVVFDYLVSKGGKARAKCEENEFLASVLSWREDGRDDQAEFDADVNDVEKALKEIGFAEDDFFIKKSMNESADNIEKARNEFIIKAQKCFDDRKMGGNFAVPFKGKWITGQCYYTDDDNDDGEKCVSFCFTDSIDNDKEPNGKVIATAYAYYDEAGWLSDESASNLFNSLIKSELNESAEDEAKEAFIKYVRRTFTNKDNGYHFAIPIGKNFITGEVEGESNGDEYIIVYLVDKVDDLGYSNGEVIKDAYISLNEEKPSDEELIELFGYLTDEDEDDKIDESVDVYELESLINKIGEENGLSNIARIIKLDKNAFLDKNTHEGAYLLKYNNYDTEAFSKEEEKTFETNVAEQVTGWCDNNGYTCKWPIAGTLVVIIEPKKIDESVKRGNDYWHNFIERADVKIDGMTFEILFLAKTADEANEFIEKCNEKCGVLTETENGIIVVAAYK